MTSAARSNYIFARHYNFSPGIVVNLKSIFFTTCQLDEPLGSLFGTNYLWLYRLFVSMVMSVSVLLNCAFLKWVYLGKEIGSLLSVFFFLPGITNFTSPSVTPEWNFNFSLPIFLLQHFYSPGMQHVRSKTLFTEIIGPIYFVFFKVITHWKNNFFLQIIKLFPFSNVWSTDTKSNVTEVEATPLLELDMLNR